MNLKDTWQLVKETWHAERELERKRREYIDLKKRPLNYPLIESIVKAAAAQNPGFYTIITFVDGTKLELGVKRRGERAAGEEPVF